MTALVLEANLPFVAVMVILALGLVLIVKMSRTLNVKVGRVEAQVSAIDRAVNQTAGRPIKEHAAMAAASSQEAATTAQDAVDRLAEIERHQSATFDRLDRLDGRLDGHALHLAGIGARVADIADALARAEDQDTAGREGRIDRRDQG